MTWIDCHTASERAAVAAEEALRGGNVEAARSLYSTAAESEEAALKKVDPAKVRTRGITAVSAVALWYRAGAYERAEQLAFSALSDASIPVFARLELRNLVQAIWTESSKQSANVGFLPGQVFVSVKGGEIVTGGAPLDLIVEKVQTIQAMFYRTIEFVKDMPLRPRGAPDREIQESCRPWLFQAAPGSYQFSVAVQEPQQRDFFSQDLRPDVVARQFLQILQATASNDQTQLEAVVPKSDYRKVFLKLCRNLAPTGKRFGSIEFRSSTGDGQIALTPDVRTTINQTIRQAQSTGAEESLGVEDEVTGILRAVDLDKDFLEVMVDERSLHVVELVDAMDDVIGPMVNKKVKVQVFRQTNGQARFRDIELDE